MSCTLAQSYFLRMTVDQFRNFLVNVAQFFLLLYTGSVPARELDWVVMRMHR